MPRTAYHGDVPFDEAVVEIAVCKGAAVGCDKQVGVVKIGSTVREHIELTRPLPQPAYRTVGSAACERFVSARPPHGVRYGVSVHLFTASHKHLPFLPQL